VGMTLAADLSRRGIKCIVVEQNATTTAHPKMDITNARSMEIFRKIGINDLLRQVAVPEDHCFDVSWITNFLGEELYRFNYDSVTEHRAKIRNVNDGSYPAESPMRVSQVEIEPVLRKHIESSPLVDVRFNVEFIDLKQDEQGVTATLLNKENQTTLSVRCDYLIGCDGGSSKVRSRLGIELSGKARTMQRYMVHFRSSRKDLLMRWGRAWHYQSVYGTLISQNDHDIWTLHSRIPPETQVETINPSDLITQFVGQEIEHEILVANPWVPHLLVANAYGKDRVFLAGDAVHQYIPTGGYGMNTGVGDAFDLSWKLAAVIKGYGGPKLLESYEAERLPIGLRNCAAAERHSKVRLEIAKLYTPEIFFNNTSGVNARNHASNAISEIGNLENECNGIEWGYSYSNSPIIIHDHTSTWVDDPVNYRPSTIPGVRLPNVFLDDGSPLFDHLGDWFTLLLTDNSPCTGFENTVKKLSVPLKLLRLNNTSLAHIYQAQAILVRPDHHVSWRGFASNFITDAQAIIGYSLGHVQT
jgi:2-polyprenyl-6-methoxyphenol hydroxylase-like FAD-dependent oxidoreductase